MRGYLRLFRWVIFFVLLVALVMIWSASIQPVVAAECKFTYENFGKDFMEKFCTRCHHSSKKGFFARKGAPDGIDFDKLEVIKKEKVEIIAETVTKKKMPPTGDKPSDEQRENVKSWLECEYK